MDLLKGALQNKTVWLNILGPVFAWLATKYGFKLSADQQLAVVTVIMAVANFGMEHLTTGLVKPTNPSLQGPKP